MNEELNCIVLRVRELYARYGIKSITMDDVARHLGMSKKTLYRYVNDKDDLVGKVVDFEIELLKKGMDCPEKKSLNAIEELLIVSQILNQRMKEINPSTVYDLRKYYPQHYERLTVARREKMFENVIANIKKGQEEGLYRTDLDPRIIAMLQISRVENIVDNDLFSINEFTSDKFFYEVFVYHIRGIANPKGIEFLDNQLKDFNINDLNFKQEK